MRVLAVLLSCVVVSSCSGTPLPRLQLGAKPAPLPAELFMCEAEPGPWAEDADDVAVATNETIRTYSGRSCRKQLHLACRVADASKLVVGQCPAP